MKLNFNEWQKVAEHPDHTVFQNRDGHQLKVSHKPLHPATRGQLAKLPMMAKGGSAGKDPTQEHLLPGDATPNKIERSVVSKAKSRMADGGEVPEPNKQAASEVQAGATESGWQPEKWKANAKAALGLAEGGKVESSGVKASDINRELDSRIESNKRKLAVSGESDSPEAKQTALGGDPQSYADGGDIVDDTAANPEASPPAAPAPEAAAQPQAAPAVDPETQQKRELYNHLVSTPTGKGFQADPSATFGPNGEAPKQFNAGAWRQAQAKFSEGQQAQAQDTQQSAIATQQENVARQSAGLAPLPVPAAQAATQADPALQGQVAQETAPKAPGDPYGTQAYSDAYTKGLGEQKQGLGLEAQAQGQLGAEQQKTYEAQAGQQQQTLQNYQTHYQNLDNERQALIKDINDNHIDPKHYWNDKSIPAKVSTAIGLIMGGMGAGLTGGPNQALDFLNKNIDRDIEGQKMNLGKQESLLSANMRQFASLRDATDMTKVMQADIVTNQLHAEAAKAMDPMAKARLLQAAGALDQQAAPVLSQIAMRKTLLSGMQAGQIPPEQVVRAIIPANEQAGAYKELQSAQNMSKGRDNLLSAFDQLSGLDTVGNRVTSPIQTPKQVNAVKEPLLAQLVKDSEGRITPQDTKMIEAFFPAAGDTAKTVAIKRAQMNKFVGEKMNYPLLRAYGIDVGNASRFSPSGQSKFQLGPVK